MAGHSLNAQLTELRLLLEEHSLILQKAVARGRLGDREASFRQGRLMAAIATMEWLQRHEDYIRAALGPNLGPLP